MATQSPQQSPATIIMDNSIINQGQNAHYQTLGEQLCTFYNSSKYSDVKITVSGRKFYGHKIILSLSTYFDAMFCAGMVESQSGEVTLQDVESNTFEMVLEFMYTGQIKLTVDTAQELLVASNMLQIPTLTNMCAAFMADHVTANNCFRLLQLADSLSLESLYHTVKVFILDEFDHLGEALDGIVVLSKDLLIDLIQDDQLSSAQETDVYEGVMKWIEHDESRMHYLAEVCQFVRFPLLPSDYVIAISNNTKLRNDTSCSSYINEALEYHMMPSRINSRLSSLRTRLRKKSNFKDIVYIITSQFPHTRKPVEIWEFDVSKHEPTRVSTLESQLYSFSNCFYNGHIYLCGGYSWVNGEIVVDTALRKYDVSQKLVSSCQAMPHAKFNHECIVMGKFMVVIGGRSVNQYESSIDVYNFTCNTWETLTLQLIGFSAVQFQGKIYIFGGKFGTESFIYSYQNIFSFKPGAQENEIFQKLCVIPDTKSCCYGKAVIVAGDQIFVLQLFLDIASPDGLTSKYFLYSPTTDTILRTAQTPQPWNRYCLAYYDGYVFVIGAIQSRSTDNKTINSVPNTGAIHRYNINNDTWELNYSHFNHSSNISQSSATSVIRSEKNLTFT